MGTLDYNYAYDGLMLIDYDSLLSDDPDREYKEDNDYKNWIESEMDFGDN